MNLDYIIFQAINNFAGQWVWLDKLGIFLAAYLQYALLVFLLTFLFIGCNAAQKNQNRLMVGLAFLSAAVSRLFFCEVIKLLVNRSRPFEIDEVNQLLIYGGGQSFPSGHAAFFFGLAAAVYLFNKKLGWLFLSGAALISLARVFAGVHYPLDILAGALVGIFSGWLVVKVFRKRQSQVITN